MKTLFIASRFPDSTLLTIPLLLILMGGCERANFNSTGPTVAPAVNAKANNQVGKAHDQDSDTIRVLFLGNSHSKQGNVTLLVKQFIEAADETAKVTCEYIKGPFLESLAFREPVREKIANGNWDVVVLQGQKISMSGRYHYSVEPAVELSKLAESAGARVLLFCEWGRRGMSGETQRIQKIYQSVADQTIARISPIGKAWELALQEDPDLELHAPDGNHANKTGAFLTASVLYGSICGEQPATLPAVQVPGVEPEQQKFLHQQASEALKGEFAHSETGQVGAAQKSGDAPTNNQPRWYRGNLHTHSLWSDGDDFPEMITRWYASHDYQFLAITDHNILARGERWMNEQKIEERGGKECLQKYREAYGDSLLKTRVQNDKNQFRLTPLAEYRSLFEMPGEFLLIEGEEVSDAVDGIPVHINATNLQQLLQPTGGATVREAIDNNLRVAADQAKRTGSQILMHINHPNYGWAITAEDLAAVSRARFFEAYNGHNGVNHTGDENHPPVERIWDIVNTLRIDKLNTPPLLGLATDDSHYYHGRPGSHPGRGWVMVRANELTPSALLTAMMAGDFYASSGVSLTSIAFDSEGGELQLVIQAEEGVTYETQFIGTRQGYDEQTTLRLDVDGNPIRATREYSSTIGEVLASETSTEPVYRMTGDELYVRAVITSCRPHPDPSFENQTEQAWTQPVGWEK